jgi:hypothetical protein
VGFQDGATDLSRFRLASPTSRTTTRLWQRGEGSEGSEGSEGGIIATCTTITAAARVGLVRVRGKLGL